MAALGKELAETRKESDRLKSLVEQFRTTNSKLTLEIERLRGLLGQKEKELAGTLQQITEVKAANKELAGILERLRPELDRVRKDQEKLKVRINFFYS